MLTTTVEERFLDKILKLPSGCWLWMGAIQGKFYKRVNGGYGSFRVNGVLTPAHRFSYEMHKEKIPKGMHIDHLCRVTSCVNPDHLEVVTARENFERGIGNKGEWNLAKTHCPSGHEYTKENTLYLFTRGRKHRACRICRREVDKRSSIKRGRRKC